MAGYKGGNWNADPEWRTTEAATGTPTLNGGLQRLFSIITGYVAGRFSGGNWNADPKWRTTKAI